MIKGLQRLCKVCIENVNNFAQMKRKYTRGNEMLFMIKELFKKTRQDLDSEKSF